MNKQEAIEKLQSKAVNHYSETSGWTKRVELDLAIDIINQFNEPEKPVVPQFLADWYEENKDGFEYNLYRLCIDFYEQKLHEDLHEWFNHDKNKPIEVLVLMNKYGYEVEQEKLYTVEIPNSNYQDSGHLVLRKDGKGKVFLDWYRSENWKEFDGVKLTEAEIKEDFAWALQFAKEAKND